MSKQMIIRDMRIKEKFFVDDAYLNGYAKLCKTNATLVYLCLCRHSDRQQESFPSVETMAEKLGISDDSVSRGIKTLIAWNIISKERERKKDKTWMNNRYLLLDKSVWKPKTDSHPAVSDLDKPPRKLSHSHPANTGNSHPAVSGTKDTHSDEGYTLKDTHIAKTSFAEGLPLNNTSTTPTTEVGNNPLIVTKSGVEISTAEKLLQSGQKHIKIIGIYAKAKKIAFENDEQVKSFIKRNLRAAQDLKGYTIQKIVDTMKYLLDNAEFKWTLESVGRFIDENLDTLKEKENKKDKNFDPIKEVLKKYQKLNNTN